MVSDNVLIYLHLPRGPALRDVNLMKLALNCTYKKKSLKEAKFLLIQYDFYLRIIFNHGKLSNNEESFHST